MNAVKRTKKTDPGTICRDWCLRIAERDMPKALLLLSPERGQGEPWFADRILGTTRLQFCNSQEVDLLELDGGSPDFSTEALFAFLGSQGLFGGSRVLLFSRAEKVLQKMPKLLDALNSALETTDDLKMVIQAFGTGKKAQALAGLGKRAPGGIAASQGVSVERFRRLYSDPPPWRPNDMDASEAAQFARTEGRLMGLNLRPGAPGALVDAVGGRPAELMDGLDKFSLLDEETVTAQRVREVVTLSAEGDAFRFTDAVLVGDSAKALQCLRQLEHRGLRTWDGKRLAPREAQSLLWATIGKQLNQTQSVVTALSEGMGEAEAFQLSGLPAKGPIATRMQSRLSLCDDIQLNRIHKSLLELEKRIKSGEWRQPLHALEWLVLCSHIKR